nr:hypothetical protein [Leuven Picorna-like virus 12]
MATQSHIPQPDGSLTFDSTMAPPEVQPSEIQTPPMPTGEVQLAAGEGNMLDPYFYEQEVKVANVVWTTSDPIGKDLYELDISPLNLYPLLRYFCRPYHAWGGSILIIVRIFGSGFHCGFIRGRIQPPGFKTPASMSMSDATVLPWRGMDAKMLDCVTFLCRDMRPMKYHLMKAPANDPMDLNIGGRFVLSVDSALSTAATGVQRINIGVWAKLCPDFRVSFLLPITDDTPLAAFPEEIVRALSPNESGAGSSMSIGPVTILNFVARPASVVAVTNGSFNSVTFDAQMRSKLDVDPKIIYPTFLGTYGEVRIVDNKKVSFRASPLWDVKSDKGFLISTEDNKSAEVQNIVYSTQGGGVTCETIGDNPFKVNDKIMWVHAFDNKLKNTECIDNETRIPNKNESFLMYSSFQTDICAFQTEELAKLLITERYRSVMPRGQCALMRMIEKSSGLPLLYVKLYSSGIMTCPATKDQLVYEAADKIFVFDSFVIESQPFPQDSQMAANRYAYLSYVNSKYSVTSV